VPIVFAAAVSHAPGITAWPAAAPAEQKAHLDAAFARLRAKLRAKQVEELVLFTSEHWTNFFLDHIGAFCIGRADGYRGPVEPWLNVPASTIRGDPDLAGAIVEAAYEGGFEPSFAYELQLDHGTMIPLHFLTPEMDVPTVPIFINTLASPQPSARRCLAFGQVVGGTLRRSPRRIGVVATGGMSHDPGERRHGIIDSEFDRRFLSQMANGDASALAEYSRQQFGAAGAGTFELLAWIALCGATDGSAGTVLAYEPVVPWATGMGIMEFAVSVP
jgi:hypothetical protein